MGSSGSWLFDVSGRAFGIKDPLVDRDRFLHSFEAGVDYREGRLRRATCLWFLFVRSLTYLFSIYQIRWLERGKHNMQKAM